MDEITPLFLSVKITAQVAPEETDELARQLCYELNELDKLSAELAQDSNLPQGAKGLPVDIGTVLVKVAEVGGITGLLAILGSWLSRDERRTIVLQIGNNKLEVTGISKEEQANLIRWFQTQSGLRLEA